MLTDAADESSDDDQPGDSGREAADEGDESTDDDAPAAPRTRKRAAPARKRVVKKAVKKTAK